VITEIKFTTSEILANSVWQWKRVRAGFNIISFHDINNTIVTKVESYSGLVFIMPYVPVPPHYKTFKFQAQFIGTSWDPIYNHCLTVYRAMHNTWTSYSQQHLQLSLLLDAMPPVIAWSLSRNWYRYQPSLNFHALKKQNRWIKLTDRQQMHTFYKMKKNAMRLGARTVPVKSSCQVAQGWPPSPWSSPGKWLPIFKFTKEFSEAFTGVT
jgi:hypothetical protein